MAQSRVDCSDYEFDNDESEGECGDYEFDNDEVEGEIGSNLTRMHRENLGKAHSDEASDAYDTESDTGSVPRNNGFRMWPQPHRNWINDISFESGENDDDDESDFTGTELVDDPVFHGPTNPLTIAPTTSRNHAFLDEWEGGWVGCSSPPNRPWVGNNPQCLYR